MPEAYEPPRAYRRFERWMRAIWSSIVEEYERTRGPGSFKLHKPYEPEKFRGIFLNVDAAERHHSVLEAASTLLSGGIIEHSFENANHRAFLTATQVYLRANGIRLPQRTSNAEWTRLANAYIKRSKRIRLELSEVPYPSADLLDTVARKHGEMTSRWLQMVLSRQSRRLELTPTILLRNLIWSGESSG